MYGIEIPKQRGIFSEILTTEDTENLRVSLPHASTLSFDVLRLSSYRFALLARVLESVYFWT